MEAGAFESRVEELVAEMIEVAHEYVDFDTDEIAGLYFFGAVYDPAHFNNFFYRTHGEIVGGARLNKVTRRQFDLSNERAHSLFAEGGRILETMKALCAKEGRPTPLFIRIAYDLATQDLDLQVDEEVPYGYDPRTVHPADIFMDWMDSLKAL